VEGNDCFIDEPEILNNSPFIWSFLDSKSSVKDLVVPQALEDPVFDEQLWGIFKFYFNWEGHFCSPHSYFIRPHCGIYLFMKKG
jgi:hypothetical protein